VKIILDESVPQKLRLLIEGVHTVVTTWFQGWSGLKNGALLTEAKSGGFDLFITADQELAYQQNPAGIGQIMTAIDAMTPGSYTEVEIPE
jgi:hypothetical protein